MYTFDASFSSLLTPVDREVFATVSDSHCKGVPYEIPSIPLNGIAFSGTLPNVDVSSPCPRFTLTRTKNQLLPTFQLSYSILQGFPTLREFELEAALRYHRIKIFGFESNEETYAVS